MVVKDIIVAAVVGSVHEVPTFPEMHCDVYCTGSSFDVSYGTHSHTLTH